MFTQMLSRIITFFALIGVMLVWQLPHMPAHPLSLPDKASLAQPLSNHLNAVVRAALDAGHRPMQIPETQQAKLVANDKDDSSRFGWSAALSSNGNVALIGALESYDGDTRKNGAAYIFERSGTTWEQRAKILANDKADDAYFGLSVAISADGNTILIGALNNRESKIGAYVFIRNGADWMQQAKLTTDHKAGGRVSVALSGDGKTVLVGAGDSSLTSAAYIFVQNNSTWAQQTKFVSDSTTSQEFFGASVALSADGNTALIGTLPLDSRSTTPNQAYIFVRSGTNWSQQAKLAADDIVPQDYFGASAALSPDGNTALISAFRKDTSDLRDHGAVYVFARTDATWVQQAKLAANDMASGDFFGASVALSADGNNALIGASTKSASTTDRFIGAAYIFARDGTKWEQRAKLFAADKTVQNYFGVSVALSTDGKTALIGAYAGKDVGSARGSGTAYVFVAP